MLIALDIGNSHVKIGGFNGDELSFVASIATDDRQSGEQYACMLKDIFSLYHVEHLPITGAIICSVVPGMHDIFSKAFRFLTNAPILNVSSKIKTGLNIKMDQPKTVGSDLVANAVWAAQAAKGPSIVVDMGTVTTFTAIDEENTLIGTTIAAGVRIMLDAVKHSAAQLPTVPLEEPRHGVFGKNTVESLKAGAIYGAAGLIDGILEHYEAALGPCNIFLTGGTAENIAPYLKSKTRLDPYITLRGLYVIWKKNQGM